MSARSRRPASSSSPIFKKPPAPVNSSTRVMAAKKSQLEKKRPPLGNITNQTNGSQRTSRASRRPMVPCSSKVSTINNEPPICIHDIDLSENSLPAPLSSNAGACLHSGDASLTRSDQPKATPTAVLALNMNSALPSRDSIISAPGITSVSPSGSVSGSVSLDETMSACDSLKSPEFEYIDAGSALAVYSIEKKANICLFLPEHAKVKGDFCKKDILNMEKIDKVVDIDDNVVDPQFCSTFACEIYKHLRESEAKRRPCTDFMERVQKDINAGMRAIMIDWLVEVAEHYRLLPDTLFLAVNYIDRYLSGNDVNRQRLQLLGVTCMMIAAKYEEICAPQVEEFCYVTDNTYFKEEVLQMESSVLNYLKFEMTTPTTKCFLRRFVCAAKGANEVPSMQFECLANYLAELSLLDYSMLHYAPSVIAASATFLAKFMLIPSKKPWSPTLHHYTLYQPSDLYDCVKALHHLCCNNDNSSLPAIREKYSQHKYKFVAKKYRTPSIPPEVFYDLSY